MLHALRYAPRYSNLSAVLLLNNDPAESYVAGETARGLAEDTMEKLEVSGVGLAEDTMEKLEVWQARY